MVTSKWPLLHKYDQPLYMKLWRQDRFISHGRTTRGNVRKTKQEISEIYRNAALRRHANKRKNAAN
jgi:hypothetical protein